MCPGVGRQRTSRWRTGKPLFFTKICGVHPRNENEACSRRNNFSAQDETTPLLNPASSPGRPETGRGSTGARRTSVCCADWLQQALRKKSGGSKKAKRHTGGVWGHKTSDTKIITNSIICVSPAMGLRGIRTRPLCVFAFFEQRCAPTATSTALQQGKAEETHRLQSEGRVYIYT